MLNKIVPLTADRNLFANLDRLNSLNDYKEAVKVEKRESLEPLALRSIYWRVGVPYCYLKRRLLNSLGLLTLRYC